jgi:hypothetical protein
MITKKRLPSHLEYESVVGVSVGIESHRDLGLEDGVVTIFLPVIGSCQFSTRMISVDSTEKRVTLLSSEKYIHTG